MLTILQHVFRLASINWCPCFHFRKNKMHTPDQLIPLQGWRPCGWKEKQRLPSAYRSRGTKTKYLGGAICVCGAAACLMRIDRAPEQTANCPARRSYTRAFQYSRLLAMKGHCRHCGRACSRLAAQSSQLSHRENGAAAKYT